MSIQIKHLVPPLLEPQTRAQKSHVASGHHIEHCRRTLPSEEKILWTQIPDEKMPEMTKKTEANKLSKPTVVLNYTSLTRE